MERVRTVKRDSPREGIVFGALYGLACAVLWCPQGPDSPPTPANVAGFIIGPAILFGAIDWAIVTKRTVYPAPAPSQQAQRRFAISYSWQF